MSESFCSNDERNERVESDLKSTGKDVHVCVLVFNLNSSKCLKLAAKIITGHSPAALTLLEQ